ncbi:MAG: hypothetical protein V5B38_20325 [Candidatus Accumulibacter propinquus]
MGIGMILLWLIPIALLVWLFAKAAAGRTSKDETHRPPPPKDASKNNLNNTSYLSLSRGISR